MRDYTWSVCMMDQMTFPHNRIMTIFMIDVEVGKFFISSNLHYLFLNSISILLVLVSVGRENLSHD